MWFLFFMNVFLLAISLNLGGVILIWILIYSRILKINTKSYLILPLLFSLIAPLLSGGIYFLLNYSYNIEEYRPFKTLFFLVVLIPIIEELIKMQVVQYLNDFMKFRFAGEGMYVGALIGIVFAFVENVRYSLLSYISNGYSAMLIVITIRIFMSSFGHPVYTGLIGASYAIQKKIPTYTIRGAFIRSCFLHIGWNFAVFSTFLLGNPNEPDYITFFSVTIVSAITISITLQQRSFQINFDNKLLKTNT